MKNETEEIWKPVPIEPYDNYYLISNKGRLRSLERYVEYDNKWGKTRRLKHESFIKPYLKEGKYKTFFLSAQHEGVLFRKSIRIDVLVDIAFDPKRLKEYNQGILKRKRYLSVTKVQLNNIKAGDLLIFKRDCRKVAYVGHNSVTVYKEDSETETVTYAHHDLSRKIQGIIKA